MNIEIIKNLIENKSAKVIYFERINSTNTYAKENSADLPHGSVIIANEQTGGRGRFEKSFYSPSETGIYFSIALKTGFNELITPAAAVAVCRAVRTLTEKELKIKWVNDILLNGQKICGILAESAGSKTEKSIIIGIGINFTTDFAGKEDTGNAGALFKKDEIPACTREKIIALTVNELLDLCENLRAENFMDEYRSLCFLTGKRISYMQNNEKHYGTVKGADDSGRLIVITTDGGETALISGEVMLVREDIAFIDNTVNLD